MAQQIINTGVKANTGGGDPLRDAMIKINENFTEVYAKVAALEDGNVVTDIKGNVFAEDSTLLVDAVNGVIPWSVIDGAPNVPTFDQTLDTTDEVAFAAVSVGNLRVAPIGNGVELLNTTNDIIITAQDDFTVSTTIGDINLYTTAGSVGIDATGGLLQMQGQNGVDISSALGDIELNAFNNNIIFSSPVVGLVGDITGSVFADDSTLLVDAVNASIPYSVLSGAPSFGNWTFNSNVLSESSTGNAVIQSSDFAGSKLILRTRGVSEKDWTFDQDGELTFPDATVQTTAYPGITVSNNTVATGSSLTRDLLTIRVDDDGNDRIHIALKYSDPDAVREVSASATWVESTTPEAGGGNLWGGSTTLSANNNTFINVTNQPFSAAGDTVTVVFTDHTAHKIYRITAQARQIPESGVVPGSAYVVIEELK